MNKAQCKKQKSSARPVRRDAQVRAHLVMRATRPPDELDAFAARLRVRIAQTP